MKHRSIGIGICGAFGAACLALACAGKQVAPASHDAGAPVADAAPDVGRTSSPGDPEYTGCYPAADEALRFATAPPRAAQGKCIGTMAADFLAACLGPGASQAKCDDFLKGTTVEGTRACGACLLGPNQAGDDPKTLPQPALIAAGDDVLLNTGMCRGLAVGAPGDCPEKMGNGALCVLSSCARCEMLDRPFCQQVAASREPCQSEQPGPACDDAVKAAQATADAKCGVPGAPFEKAYALMAAFICGSE